MAPPTELVYAVRLRVVLKYLGQLCLVLAVLTLVPAVGALVFGEGVFAWRYLAVTGLLAAGGTAMARLRAPASIQTNEALVIVGGMFVLTPILMAYPLSAQMTFSNALFEAISGVTTTGLSVAGTVADKPRTFLFTRAWMQWYGGLGFVVLSVVLLAQDGGLAKRLGTVETEGEDLIGGTRAHARRVALVYGTLTLAGIAVLWPLGGGLYQAVVHTLAAVSTGGFSSYDRSLADMESWLPRAVVMLLCLAGGVSLMFWRRLYRTGWRGVRDDLQLRTVLVAGILGTTGVTTLLVASQRTGWTEAVGHAALTAFSAQTTAGFSTIAPMELAPASKLILIVSMLVGGGVGSTAGGFKVLRLLILIRLVTWTMVRTALPSHAVHELRLDGHRIDDAELQQALLIVLLFVIVVVASWLPFLVLGYEPLDALFEVVSATGTVGLSTGVTRPELEPMLKTVLSADMLLGRLEMIALFVLVYPRTWVGKRARPS